MKSVGPEKTEAANSEAHDAFVHIYEMCYPRCFGFFRARVLDTGVAADLTQETFLRAYDAMDRYDASRPAESWLMGICRNVLREYVRAQRRRKEIPWAELCLELAEAAGEDDELVDMMPHLHGCISKLAPKTETALRAHYFQGKKLTVVAEEMSQSLSAIKMALLRARRAIKTCIRKKLQGAQ